MARHVYLCPMRWSDMDAYSHVNNVQYLRYLEDARVDMLITQVGAAGESFLKSGVVVASHQINYRAPLVFRPEPVPIESWVSKVSVASFTLGYEIKDDDQVYATASTVLAAFDLERQRPRRLTSDERAFLEKYAEEVYTGP